MVQKNQENIHHHQDESCLEVRQSRLDQDVVKMHAVGVKGGLAAQVADPEYPQGVENGDCQDPHRYGWCCPQVQHRFGGDGRFTELNHEKGEDISQHQRPGVAHEDLVLFAENIEIEK